LVDRVEHGRGPAWPRAADSSDVALAVVLGQSGLVFSIDAIELYERNMIDELAPMLVHGSYR
jgi:hypothetical protein